MAAFCAEPDFFKKTMLFWPRGVCAVVAYAYGRDRLVLLGMPWCEAAMKEALAHRRRGFDQRFPSVTASFGRGLIKGRRDFY